VYHYFFLQDNVLFNIYIRHFPRRFNFWRVAFPDVPVLETSRHFLVSCNLDLKIREQILCSNKVNFRSSICLEKCALRAATCWHLSGIFSLELPSVLD
jgi:hypothetical protein